MLLANMQRHSCFEGITLYGHSMHEREADLEVHHHLPNFQRDGELRPRIFCPEGCHTYVPRREIGRFTNGYTREPTTSLPGSCDVYMNSHWLTC